MNSLLRMFILIAASLLLCAQTCLAQDDLPCEWTGLYLGAHLGAGFSSTHMNLHDLGTVRVLHPDPGGVIGGGQIGYNLQRGPFVLGLEADLSDSGMNGNANSFPPPGIMGGTSIRSSQNINWFGTLRPRLGYTVMPRLLLYATGGLAYGDVSYWERAVSAEPATFGPGSYSGVNLGWTVGGGLEYLISKNWSAKAEYLFCNLGDQNVTAVSQWIIIPLTTTQSTAAFSTEFSVFDVGLNYRFD
ncbi:MAG: outer membrane protein [Syntrophobacteraceae bacterium]